jgi:hypothetical protein
MSFDQSKSSLFDVVDSYSHALKVSRISRGEPVDGIQRQVWESRQWLKRNRFKVAFGGVLILVAVRALFALRSRRLARKNTPEALEDLRAA